VHRTVTTGKQSDDEAVVTAKKTSAYTCADGRRRRSFIDTDRVGIAEVAVGTAEVAVGIYGSSFS
jgi:hypothetical protein